MGLLAASGCDRQPTAAVFTEVARIQVRLRHAGYICRSDRQTQSGERILYFEPEMPPGAFPPPGSGVMYLISKSGEVRKLP
jgi:hypothetical protein